MFKHLASAVSVLAFTAALAASTVAQAETTFSGTTTGCFTASSGGCVPSFTTTANGGLSFTGSSFTGTTSNNELAFGGPGTNFGTFTLSGADGTYSGYFTIGITFTAPTGTNPGSTTNTATLRGSVSNGTNGGVRIAFDNTPMNFTFPGGGFTLTLDTLSVFPGKTNDVSGFIVATPGPVAGAGVVALLGLAGLAGFARRRQTTAL